MQVECLPGRVNKIERFLMLAAAALLLEQFSRGRSTAAGWAQLIGFLILLLLGGIALLVHAVIDFRREHKAAKREEEERAKRKAA
jgi:hypothetical protein